MPPTTNPAPWATASFVVVSVVRIARAASGPPSGASAAAAPRTPERTLQSGSGTPITPVERSRISSASRSSSRAASAAVARASSSPRSPVAAFAFAEFATTACGSASSRFRRETTTGAAWTRLTVNIPAPVAGSSERTIARSGRVLRSPQWTPLATNPLAAVTLTRSLRRSWVQLPPGGRPGPCRHRTQGGAPCLCRRCAGCVTPGRATGGAPCSSDRHSRQLQAEGLVEVECEVRVLHRLPGGALAEVVERADDHRPGGRPILVDADLRAVRVLHARELGRDAVGQDPHGRRACVRGLDQVAPVAVDLRVARRDQPAAHGQQVRDEADRVAERAGDLGCVLVAPDPVRRHVLEHEPRVRAGLQLAPGARHPGLRVHHDRAGLDRPRKRCEREDRGGRVTAGFATRRPTGGLTSGSP